MKTCFQALGLALTALWVGCADFEKAEQGFCERNPDRCGPSPGGDGGVPSYSRIAFTTAPQTVQVGNCSEVTTVQLQDTRNSPVSVTADTVVALSAEPPEGFQFFTGADCTGTAVPSVTIRAGSSSASFYFKGTRGGAATLNASTGGISGSQGVTLSLPPPASVALTLPGGSVTAGTCTSASVQMKDSSGADTRVGAATEVSLQATPTGGIAFYSDVGCTTPTAIVTVAAGEGSATFYFQGQIVGSVTINATSTGLMEDSKVVQILPGAGNRLVFTSQAQTLIAGGCSQPVQFQNQDAQGNVTPVAATTTVMLVASPSAGFKFYSDVACNTEVTSATLAAGASSGSFRFRGTKSGNVTVTLTATGLTGSSQNETIDAGTPVGMVFTGPQTLQAGNCSGLVTIELRDSFGNQAVAGGGGTSINLTTTGVALTYSTSGTCTPTTTSVSIASGASTTSFRYRGTTAGTATISGTATGLTPTPLDATVNPGPAATLLFTTAPQTFSAGSCSAATTVRLLDAFNNPVRVTAGTAVMLSASPATGFQFFADSSCTGAPVTSVNIPANSSDATFYFRGTSAGTVTMSATASGVPAATQSVTINPGAPTELAITTAPQAVPATGCSAVATVETRASGVPTTVTTATTVTLSAAPSTGFTFYVNSNCTTMVTQVTISTGQGSANFYFKGTTPGVITITTASAGLTSATQNTTITPPPTKLQFSTPPHTTTAGVCSAMVTVQTADASNNVAPVATSTIVYLTETGIPTDPQFRFYSDASCGIATTSVSIPAGQSTASFYYKGEKVRTVTLTAAASGLTNGTQDHTMVAGNAAALAFSAATPAQTLLAGTCSNIRTVETRDAFGNLATNGATIILTGSTLTEFFQDLNCTTPLTNPVTITAGNSTTGFYFKGFTGGINANGTLTLTAAATGLTSATQAETIMPTVRTGACSMSGTSVNCTVTPALLDMNRAFLVFQATSTNTSSDQSNVRCFLITTSQVRCERASTSGVNVNIRWSAAEFPSGVNVQHRSVNCGGDTTSVTLNDITPAQSFLLLSSQRAVTGMGSSVPRLAELTSTTLAQIRKTGGCVVTDNNHLQVVDYTGASVQRGLTSLTNGSASTQVNLPTSVALSRSILLYSYISDGSGPKICDRVLRGELTNGGTSVTFSRGGGDTANCTGSSFTSISWEVVQFPVGTVVQQVTQPLAGGAVDVGTTIQEVDLSRTIVIGGGQWASGQLHGEGRHSASELISEMRAQAYLPDSTHLNFFRETANNTATFTAYVIQFKP